MNAKIDKNSHHDAWWLDGRKENLILLHTYSNVSLTILNMYIPCSGGYYSLKSFSTFVMIYPIFDLCSVTYKVE